ncbi:uncharacterized protein CTHT_0041840 [Thermochaetoides thermophila DSM 1495]|uniref:Uncharacterized protein n=1 Tax=Chaetomium thermophilum (strain DSM 1495 / CBS 144.50 / IMI 039719) TaxID=759272 RepID=G0SAD0_CHATD|nr:hypothetical protein CTHT_0041840 [Thermochaetoides thermophila DSM 1495]EGS19702.1 hypothetical protein CTHT_0041840 [Thermochaetoides thermophila DSM 1495]
MSLQPLPQSSPSYPILPLWGLDESPLTPRGKGGGSGHSGGSSSAGSSSSSNSDSSSSGGSSYSGSISWKDGNGNSGSSQGSCYSTEKVCDNYWCIPNGATCCNHADGMYCNSCVSSNSFTSSSSSRGGSSFAISGMPAQVAKPQKCPVLAVLTWTALTYALTV